MTSLISMPLLRRASVLAAAILLAACITKAQSITSSDSRSSDSSFSSSQSGITQTELAEFRAPALLAPGGSSASPGGSAAGQYGSGGSKNGFLHNRSWTFEGGGGFNAPEGNDTPYITWGANFTGGGGLRLNKRVSVLLEYQFMDNKLPGAFIATAGQGASGGNSHINSITGSPVIDLFSHKSNGVYLVGGYGFYHKSTNFNVQVCCDFYGYPVTINTNSFSSNQMGANGGIGLFHQIGGVYGDGKTRLFAEARYTYIHTPPVTQTNGLGTTELIPVTLGIRF